MGDSRLEDLTDQQLTAGLTHMRAGATLDRYRAEAQRRGLLPAEPKGDAQRGEAFLKSFTRPTTEF